jgi:putative Mn2+ efflux pump MntP
MNPVAIFFLAMAMSTDAFAAAVGKGTALQQPRWSEALRTGLIFGVIEAITPIIGWAMGYAAADYVKAWDHWIAFVLLGLLGARMIWAASKASDEEGVEKPSRHSFWVLAVTGFATSIDAMAVGVGLAFLNVNIFPIAIAIGFATCVMVTIGVMVGRVLGKFAGRWAEAVGGVVLIIIGSTILYQHLTGAG